MRNRLILGLVSAFFCVAASQCELPGEKNPTIDLGSTRMLSILQTNDLHGGVEAQVNADGKVIGGVAILGGVVQSIRKGLQDQFGAKAGVLVVDSGDQFQGTLISNYNEGELMYAAMSEIGYDAVVPGNHAYDFGPLGWLEDTVTSDAQDPRGVIKKIAKEARFPLLSANTFLRNSFQDLAGNKLQVANVGCKVPAGQVVDWSKVRQPEFLSSYFIKNVAGVRVALIGIDSRRTSESTSISNVQDLCFADEVETYLRVRAQIENQADVFVMLLHDGNMPSSREEGAIKIAMHLGLPNQLPLVDAIIAGHTHTIQEEAVNGIPILQSTSGTKSFGRLDLFWNSKHKTLDRTKTRIYGGVELSHSSCSKKAASFCVVDPRANGPVYEGRLTAPDPSVQEIVDDGKHAVAPISERKLGIALRKLWVDRTKESPLGNLMTDQLRELSGADIAFINTGGLREALQPGEFTYSTLFNVLPFNNRAVILQPLTANKLFALLLRSAKTCGKYGALMQSGLKVEFSKKCETGTLDEEAKLVRVETVAGEVLLNGEQGIQVPDTRVFKVATLDFLATGGSGYADFIGAPVVADLGVLREVLTDQFLKLATSNGKLTEFKGVIDGRWKELPR